VGGGVGQHRRRVVDARHLGDGQALGQLGRQRAGAAAEIDGAVDRGARRPDPRLADEVGKIPERLGPLSREPFVLLRLPVTLRTSTIDLTGPAPFRRRSSSGVAHEYVNTTAASSRSTGWPVGDGGADAAAVLLA